MFEVAEVGVSFDADSSVSVCYRFHLTYITITIIIKYFVGSILCHFSAHYPTFFFVVSFTSKIENPLYNNKFISGTPTIVDARSYKVSPLLE